ncbi:MAG: ribonuclease T2 [Pseudomonadota bacterium]
MEDDSVTRLLAILAFIWPLSAAADDDFTHYVLALSWNASWCKIEGDARGADQCDPRHDLGFTLHGLWPQGERDWPEYCRSNARDPSRSMSGKMADIMGSGGLAWHQWKKHGRCSELSARDYFDLSREAYGMIDRPAVLRKLDKQVKISPSVVEKAFLEANPKLRANQISVTCRDGLVHEVRVCLSKALVPRACTAKVERGCRAKSVLLPPMR